MTRNSPEIYLVESSDGDGLTSESEYSSDGEELVDYSSFELFLSEIEREEDEVVEISFSKLFNIVRDFIAVQDRKSIKEYEDPVFELELKSIEDLGFYQKIKRIKEATGSKAVILKIDSLFDFTTYNEEFIEVKNALNIYLKEIFFGNEFLDVTKLCFEGHLNKSMIEDIGDFFLDSRIICVEDIEFRDIVFYSDIEVKFGIDDERCQKEREEISKKFHDIIINILNKVVRLDSLHFEYGRETTDYWFQGRARMLNNLAICFDHYNLLSGITDDSNNATITGLDWIESVREFNERRSHPDIEEVKMDVEEVEANVEKVKPLELGPEKFLKDTDWNVFDVLDDVDVGNLVQYELNKAKELDILELIYNELVSATDFNLEDFLKSSYWNRIRQYLQELKVEDGERNIVREIESQIFEADLDIDEVNFNDLEWHDVHIKIKVLLKFILEKKGVKRTQEEKEIRLDLKKKQQDPENLLSTDSESEEEDLEDIVKISEDEKESDNDSLAVQVEGLRKDSENEEGSDNEEFLGVEEEFQRSLEEIMTSVDFGVSSSNLKDRLLSHIDFSKDKINFDEKDIDHICDEICKEFSDIDESKIGKNSEFALYLKSKMHSVGKTKVLQLIKVYLKCIDIIVQKPKEAQKDIFESGFPPSGLACPDGAIGEFEAIEQRLKGHNHIIYAHNRAIMILLDEYKYSCREGDFVHLRGYLEHFLGLRDDLQAKQNDGLFTLVEGIGRIPVNLTHIRKRYFELFRKYHKDNIERDVKERIDLVLFHMNQMKFSIDEETGNIIYKYNEKSEEIRKNISDLGFSFFDLEYDESSDSSSLIIIFDDLKKEIVKNSKLSEDQKKKIDSVSARTRAEKAKDEDGNVILDYFLDPAHIYSNRAYDDIESLLDSNNIDDISFALNLIYDLSRDKYESHFADRMVDIPYFRDVVLYEKIRKNLRHKIREKLDIDGLRLSQQAFEFLKDRSKVLIADLDEDAINIPEMNHTSTNFGLVPRPLRILLYETGENFLADWKELDFINVFNPHNPDIEQQYQQFVFMLLDRPDLHRLLEGGLLDNVTATFKFKLLHISISCNRLSHIKYLLDISHELESVSEEEMDQLASSFIINLKQRNRSDVDSLAQIFDEFLEKRMKEIFDDDKLSDFESDSESFDVIPNFVKCLVNKLIDGQKYEQISDIVQMAKKSRFRRHILSYLLINISEFIEQEEKRKEKAENGWNNRQYESILNLFSDLKKGFQGCEADFQDKLLEITVRFANLYKKYKTNSPQTTFDVNDRINSKLVDQDDRFSLGQITTLLFKHEALCLVSNFVRAVDENDDLTMMGGDFESIVSNSLGFGREGVSRFVQIFEKILCQNDNKIDVLDTDNLAKIIQVFIKSKDLGVDFNDIQLHIIKEVINILNQRISEFKSSEIISFFEGSKLDETIVKILSQNHDDALTVEIQNELRKIYHPYLDARIRKINGFDKGKRKLFFELNRHIILHKIRSEDSVTRRKYSRILTAEFIDYFSELLTKNKRLISENHTAPLKSKEFAIRNLERNFLDCHIIFLKLAIYSKNQKAIRHITSSILTEEFMANIDGGNYSFLSHMLTLDKSSEDLKKPNILQSLFSDLRQASDEEEISVIKDNIYSLLKVLKIFNSKSSLALRTENDLYCNLIIFSDRDNRESALNMALNMRDIDPNLEIFLEMLSGSKLKTIDFSSRNVFQPSLGETIIDKNIFSLVFLDVILAVEDAFESPEGQENNNFAFKLLDLFESKNSVRTIMRMTPLNPIAPGSHNYSQRDLQAMSNLSHSLYDSGYFSSEFVQKPKNPSQNNEIMIDLGFLWDLTQANPVCQLLIKNKLHSSDERDQEFLNNFKKGFLTSELDHLRFLNETVSPELLNDLENKDYFSYQFYVRSQIINLCLLPGFFLDEDVEKIFEMIINDENKRIFQQQIKILRNQGIESQDLAKFNPDFNEEAFYSRLAFLEESVDLKMSLKHDMEGVAWGSNSEEGLLSRLEQGVKSAKRRDSEDNKPNLKSRRKEPDSDDENSLDDDEAADFPEESNKRKGGKADETGSKKGKSRRTKPDDSDKKPRPKKPEPQKRKAHEDSEDKPNPKVNRVVKDLTQTIVSPTPTPQMAVGGQMLPSNRTNSL